MKPVDTLTEAAFAKRRGVSRECVRKWKGRGLVKITAGGLVDVRASEKLLDDRPAQYRGGRTKAAPATAKRAGKAKRDKSKRVAAVSLDPARWSTSEAIRRKEVAQARLRQIEADTAAGLVVPIADISKVVGAEYAAVRATLLAMPAKLAHALAAATAPEEAGRLVEVEIHAALAALTAGGA